LSKVFFLVDHVLEPGEGSIVGQYPPTPQHCIFLYIKEKFQAKKVIDPDFNLLDLYHVPNGFFCPLTLAGKGLIEPNAPMGTFPAIAYGGGTNMPVWFVDKNLLAMAMADGILTLPELQGLNPLKGVASRYEEFNKPRSEEDYLLVIESEGTITGTNQRFEYKVISKTKARQDVELRIW
jgi:hypothetical protein